MSGLSEALLWPGSKAAQLKVYVDFAKLPTLELAEKLTPVLD
jgi:hypothetical protein